MKPLPLAFPIQNKENSENVIISWSFSLFALLQFRLISIGQTAVNVSANNALYVSLPKKIIVTPLNLLLYARAKRRKNIVCHLQVSSSLFSFPFQKSEKKPKKYHEGGWQSIVAYLEVGAKFREVCR